MNKVLVINPYNSDQVELLNEFETSNNTVKSYKDSNYKTTMTKKEYIELQRKSNEVNHEIAIESEGKIKEVCYISGVKDIKHCTLSFKTSNNSPVSKKIIKLGTDYAFNTIGMETVFINVDNNNQKLMRQLEDLNFINLGEEEDKTTYLIEKEEKNIGSMQSEHNQKF